MEGFGFILFIISCYLQVGLATFAVYIFTKDDHRIDAQTAFVAITLFNILRFAVLVAPIMVMELVKVFLCFL